KEDAHDYRYFPDPDLPALEVDEAWVERTRKELPELPQAKRERYQRDFGLSAYDAGLLTESSEKARYFEGALKPLGAAAAKTVANWVNGEVSALVNERAIDFGQFQVTAERFAKLVNRVRDGTISTSAAKEVLHAMVEGGGNADEIIDKRGLKQLSDTSAIEKVVDEVLSKNAKQVEDYRAGKEKAFNSLVGQVMKATQGKANPAQVNELLRRKLGR